MAKRNVQSPTSTPKRTLGIEASTVPEIRAESEALFRSIGDGAIATDEFGYVTRVNPTALAILGLTREEVIGNWFPRVVVLVRADNTPLPLIERPIVKVFLTGQPVSEKVHLRTKAGRIVPVGITVSPIILRERPVGAIELIRDITVETEIDRMKSEFISLASHQLRTPLSTIKTYSHMLIDGYMGKVSPEQARTLKTITNATNNMNELISTLLNIARIESGTIQVHAKRLDVGRLAQELVKQVKLSADTKGITVSAHIPKHPTFVRTDHLIIREILLNLLNNAIKYSGKDATVSVTVRNRQHDVLFVVQDTGMGIPLEAHEQIFAKFFRAQNVVRHETSGTGLGLYVVKGLVSALEGHIWFKSEENHGSAFYVTLPKGSVKKARSLSSSTAEV